jgi:hypothetical protein
MGNKIVRFPSEGEKKKNLVLGNSIKVYVPVGKYPESTGFYF